MVNGSALYAKAATGTAFLGNTITIAGPTLTAYAFREGADGANKAVNTTLMGNTITLNGSNAQALLWGDGTMSAGGAEANDNNITLSGSATLGSVRGTLVSTQADLRAVWAAHGLAGDDPANDSRSLVA